MMHDDYVCEYCQDDHELNYYYTMLRNISYKHIHNLQCNYQSS